MRLGGRVKQEKKLWARELRRGQTQAELRLWSRLRRRQLGGWQFRRQVVLRGFIVDFFCRAARLVVEVDGSIHLKQRGYDAWRQDILERKLGVRFVRVSNSLVFRDRAAALAHILGALEAGTSIDCAEPWSDIL
jgi:very-short-patch-repair endonuclease